MGEPRTTRVQFRSEQARAGSSGFERFPSRPLPWVANAQVRSAADRDDRYLTPLAKGGASMETTSSNDLAVIASLAGQELSEHRSPGEDTVVLLTVLVR